MPQPTTSTTLRKSGLTDGQLVLMGKGLFRALKPSGDKPYQGGAGPIVDHAQSELNRKAGYWTPGRNG